MSKQPYIPLYIGDWEQDTNTISLEAEGALAKLTFKLWKAETRGSVTFRFSQLAILFKKPEEITRKIIAELHENKVLNMEFLPENQVKIESRRMLHEAAIALINKENGTKGGRPSKKFKKNNNRTKSETKAKHNPPLDIVYANESDILLKGKKGAGKKGKPFVPPTLEEWTAFFLENEFDADLAKRSWTGYQVADWYDTGGNKIKNWKQKAIYVWFKPQNKNNGSIKNHHSGSATGLVPSGKSAGGF